MCVLCNLLDFGFGFRAVFFSTDCHKTKTKPITQPISNYSKTKTKVIAWLRSTINWKLLYVYDIHCIIMMLCCKSIYTAHSMHETQGDFVRTSMFDIHVHWSWWYMWTQDCHLFCCKIKLKINNSFYISWTQVFCSKTAELF